MKATFHRILWPFALVAVAGCGDLALNPGQEPAIIELTPEDTLMTAGDAAQLRILVFDRDYNPLPGPPSWAPPTWEWTDSGAVDIASDGRLQTNTGGDLRVTANLAGLTAWTKLRINPSSIVLTAPSIYFNQVIQNLEGDVPLIAGRPGLLRVFAAGDEVSFYQLSVRAELYRDSEVVQSAVMPSGSDVLLNEPDESRLDRSFNMEVPAELIQPGLELAVELDVENTVPKAPGSITRYPAQGTTPLNIIEMPVFQQTFVPTILNRSPDHRVFAWLRGIAPDSRHVEVTRTLLPIGDMEISVHDTFYTDSNLTTNNGWQAYLREVRVLWNLEGRMGYYYGVVQLPGGSPWGGLGYIDGTHVSVGAPNPDTYAHEIGHNMTLRHAPCGGAGSPDPGFPSSHGSIGRWGYDFQASRLISPSQYKDLMGYCSPNWVSDYHFKKAMDHRLATNETPVAAALPEQTLMLWGSASHEEVLLEPAFLVEAVPDMPTGGGAWRLTGFGPGGERRFDFGFTPSATDHGGADFMFNIPYDPERDGVLESVVLSGPDGEVTLGRSGAPPMAIIRNRATGQVRAILRNWAGGFARVAGDVEIMVSEGLPGGGS